jgi:HTH-type transcriptional regulator/antitoxin HigA
MTKKTNRVSVSAKSLVSATVTKTQKQSKPFRIGSEEAYQLTMQEIDALMRKGEGNLSDAEKKRLGELADAAERYEDTTHPLPLPATLPDIIRMKMMQLRIRQNYAARLLGVSDTKFSMIMNGNQKPDIYFIKAVHDKLKVDANILLKAIA